MPRPRLLCALVLTGVLLGSSAPAQTVCDQLGELGKWQIVATSRLVTKWRGNRFDPLGTIFDGPTCTAHASLGLNFVQGLGFSNLVSTATTATAIRYFQPAGEFSGDLRNVVDGDIATGGGAVAGPLFRVGGVVDTSGSHPAVAACRQAIADASAASAAFAALPPDLTFGNVIARNGEVVTLDVRGARVVQIDALIAPSARLSQRDDGVPPNCDEANSSGIGIEADRDVVLNVGRFGLGNCNQLQSVGARSVVINLPGPRPKVRIGPQALIAGVAILAPERSVQVDGSYLDNETGFNEIWGKRLTMRGFAVSFDSGANCFF